MLTLTLMLVTMAKGLFFFFSSTDVVDFDGVAIRRAGPRGGGGLLYHALELDDDLGCNLVPQQASRVDVGSGLALVLLAHGGERLGEVATVRGLRAGRQWIAKVITGDTIPGASVVHRVHAVVLGRLEREELFVLLLLGDGGELGGQLVEGGSGQASHAGSRLGPGKAGWARFDHGDAVGNQALLGDGGRDAGILEDAVQHGSRGSTDIVGHAGNRRGSGARLAGNESAAEEKHEQKTGSDRLVFVLGARNDGERVLLLLARCLFVEVVVEDVVVPFVAAHVEVIHVGGEVVEGGAGGHGGGVVGSALEPLGEDGDLLAKLAGLEGVGADELFLVELELVDDVVHLQLLAVPVLLLGSEGIVLHAQVVEVILEGADLLGPRLLLLFELFRVLLLPLPGIKSVIMLAMSRGRA